MDDDRRTASRMDGRLEGQSERRSEGRMEGCMDGRSEPQLTAALLDSTADESRGSQLSHRSDIVSRTTLPGYRSGMAIATSRQKNNGEETITWFTMVKEPYSSWKRLKKRPAKSRDKDIDTCLLCSFCILSLACVGAIVYLCITSTSPRKATVYSVDSIVIPEEKVDRRSDEDGGGEGVGGEGGREAAGEGETNSTDLLEARLEAETHRVSLLEEELHRMNESLRQRMQLGERRLTDELAAMEAAQSTLLETALARDFCELTTLLKMQSKDDADFTAHPTFDNCEGSVEVPDGTALLAASSSSSSSSSSFTPKRTVETFVGIGRECDIICDEKAGFFSPKAIAPSVYKNAPTSIRCSSLEDVVDGVVESGGDSSGGGGSGNGSTADVKKLHPKAVWTMSISSDGKPTVLSETNLPICYKLHCPKSQLDSGANFKCITQSGPGEEQVVPEGGKCIFLGCSPGTQRRSGQKNTIFTCGSDGKFHTQPTRPERRRGRRRRLRMKPDFPHCQKSVAKTKTITSDSTAETTSETTADTKAGTKAGTTAGKTAGITAGTKADTKADTKAGTKAKPTEETTADATTDKSSTNLDSLVKESRNAASTLLDSLVKESRNAASTLLDSLVKVGAGNDTSDGSTEVGKGDVGSNANGTGFPTINIATTTHVYDISKDDGRSKVDGNISPPTKVTNSFASTAAAAAEAAAARLNGSEVAELNGSSVMVKSKSQAEQTKVSAAKALNGTVSISNASGKIDKPFKEVAITNASALIDESIQYLSNSNATARVDGSFQNDAAEMNSTESSEQQPVRSAKQVSTTMTGNRDATATTTTTTTGNRDVVIASSTASTKMGSATAKSTVLSQCLQTGDCFANESNKGKNLRNISRTRWSENKNAQDLNIS